jgi:Protein of unknown function (DUF3311)
VLQDRLNGSGPEPRRRPTLTWLLAVPLLGLAWPPMYNRLEPRAFGVPFFYAYQLAMILVAAACMVAVYRARRP